MAHMANGVCCTQLAVSRHHLERVAHVEETLRICPVHGLAAVVAAEAKWLMTLKLQMSIFVWLQWLK